MGVAQLWLVDPQAREISGMSPDRGWTDAPVAVVGDVRLEPDPAALFGRPVCCSGTQGAPTIEGHFP